jgi:hypothetical protein
MNCARKPSGQLHFSTSVRLCSFETQLGLPVYVCYSGLSFILENYGKVTVINHKKAHKAGPLFP